MKIDLSQHNCYCCLFDVQLSSSSHAVFVGQRKNIGFLLFELVLYVFSPIFSGVFLNIIRYGKRMEILSSEDFCVFNFLTVCHATRKTKFVVFLQVIHIKLIFLILWPFIHWTINKRCLETWSWVCGYCTCGLFLCFRLLSNIRNIFKKPVIKR